MIYLDTMSSDISNWQLKSKKTLFKHPRFTVVDYYLQTPDNQEVIFTFMEKPVDFSLIIPKQGKYFYLIRQFRPSTKKISIEFPMGSTDSDDMLQTAKIELQEETGFTARKWKKLGQIYPSPGSIKQQAHIYLAEDLTPGPQKLEKGEYIEVIKLDEKQIQEYILKGDIFEGTTLSAYAIYQAYTNRG